MGIQLEEAVWVAYGGMALLTNVEGEDGVYRCGPDCCLIAEGDVDVVHGVDEGADRDTLADTEGSLHEEVMESQGLLVDHPFVGRASLI
jgi:hypothetical protein